MAEAAHIGVNLAEDAVPARSLQSLRFVEHSMPARSTVSLRARCGSSALPVLVAVAGFAVVLGAMYFITRADKVKLSRTETSVETTSRPLARETGSPSLPVRTVSERVEPDEIVLADSAVQIDKNAVLGPRGEVGSFGGQRRFRE